MAGKFSLTTEETYILAEKMHAEKDPKKSRRLFAISLRHFGYKIREIALLTSATERSVLNWFRAFEEGGFEQLLSFRYASERNSRLNPYVDKIRNHIEAHPDIGAVELHSWIRDKHGVEVEFSWFFRFLKNRKLL